MKLLTILLLVFASQLQASDFADSTPPPIQAQYAKRRLSEAMHALPSAQGWGVDLAIDEQVGAESFFISARSATRSSVSTRGS